MGKKAAGERDTTNNVHICKHQISQTDTMHCTRNNWRPENAIFTFTTDIHIKCTILLCTFELKCNTHSHTHTQARVLCALADSLFRRWLAATTIATNTYQIYDFVWSVSVLVCVHCSYSNSDTHKQWKNNS